MNKFEIRLKPKRKKKSCISAFLEYALPLKRERWRAKRAGEGATCRGGFAYAQHDGNQTIFHPEVYRRISRKGKTRGL